MEQSSGSQMLFVGTTCSEEHCSLNDFLPLRCQHCTKSFCSDHFKPTAHACPHFDPAKHDRVAPQCPLCNTPVSVPVGGDPNERMEVHITTECTAAGHKGKTATGPTCANPKCRKHLITPIVCNDCKQMFCPTHRFPSGHTCVDKSAARSTSAPPTSQASATSAKMAAGMAAFQRSLANAKTSATTKANASLNVPTKAPTASRSTPSLPTASTSTSGPAAAGSSKSGPSNPFNKTDRRAKAELESRRKAIKEKARKGILSEAESKRQLKELDDAAKESGDCIIA